MKKIISFLIVLCFLQNLFCQQVIINASNKNRLLTWNDFTGKPDKSSSFEANTYWEISYSFKGISFKKGDTATIEGFAVTLTFNTNKSWVKKGSETDYLLQHEQGHFNTGLLCQAEMFNQIKSTVFLKNNFQDKLKAIFSNTMEKYHAMGLKYDEETDHSKNKESQEKWNTFFTKTMQQ